jgi:hypothetical protein
VRAAAQRHERGQASAQATAGGWTRSRRERRRMR